jgi:hypothetical protein
VRTESIETEMLYISFSRVCIGQLILCTTFVLIITQAKDRINQKRTELFSKHRKLSSFTTERAIIKVNLDAFTEKCEAVEM